MTSSIGVTYNEFMGFAINGESIPDPSSYDYSSQSLDTSAERDTTGLLHRKMVDTKYNVALQWQGLDYVTAQSIITKVVAPEFTFTFPCPEIPITVNNGLYTGRYYVGDRKVSIITAREHDDMSKWMCSLSFDLIEY